MSITKRMAEEISEAVGFEGETPREVMDLGKLLLDICKKTERTFKVADNGIVFTPTPNIAEVPDGTQVCVVQKEEEVMEGKLIVETYLYQHSQNGVYLEQWGTIGRKARLFHRIYLDTKELVVLGEKAKELL